jgi:hypothetical protein
MRRGQDEQRFWDKVQRGAACWNWVGTLMVTGYGGIRYHGKNRTAHRVSYELHYGPIPDGLQIDHACRNRLCVNPDHLRAVRDGENKQNLANVNARSRSGVRGVSWFARYGKWMAKTTLAGKQYYLGYFDDLQEAERVVSEWRREHMPYSEVDKKKEAAS